MQLDLSFVEFRIYFFPLSEISSPAALKWKKGRILLVTGAQELRVMHWSDCESRHCRCCDRHTLLRRVYEILPLLSEFHLTFIQFCIRNVIDRLWASWKSAIWNQFFTYGSKLVATLLYSSIFRFLGGNLHGSFAKGCLHFQFLKNSEWILTFVLGVNKITYIRVAWNRILFWKQKAPWW
jgi:hypothetical protein